MDLQQTLLNALASYGVVAIFVSILVSSIGLPLPTSFLLIVAGSFVAQGNLTLWQVVLAGVLGAVIGDHLGFCAGWFGGRGIINRIVQRFRAQALMDKAESTSRKYGGISVFLSRWLITAVGPYINLTSGIARYAPIRFTLWVVLGETLWVLLYVQLGNLFSNSLTTVTDALGDFTYVILGLAVVLLIVYQLIKQLRHTEKPAVA